MSNAKKAPKLKETKTVKDIRKACKKLHAAGWKTVHFEYCGSGDSCDSFAVSLENEENAVFACDAVKTLPADFEEDKFRELLLDLLPVGFENNEGGDGNIKIDTDSGQILVKHNTYYTESHHEEWSY